MYELSSINLKKNSILFLQLMIGIVSYSDHLYFRVQELKIELYSAYACTPWLPIEGPVDIYLNDI